MITYTAETLTFTSKSKKAITHVVLVDSTETGTTAIYSKHGSLVAAQKEVVLNGSGRWTNIRIVETTTV